MKKFMFLLVSLLFSNAEATPIEWDIASGGNGHYYERIDYGGSISWIEAKQLAENMTFQGRQGHLATITSQAETAFISNISAWYESSAHAWLGAEYHGEWNWVTGEEWNYTNWESSQPNNLSSPGGDYLLGYFIKNAYNPLWGDAWNTWPGTTSFIVEYTYDSSTVPEPNTMILFSMGCLGLASALRKKRH